jgi:hypothetical protein
MAVAGQLLLWNSGFNSTGKTGHDTELVLGKTG